MQRKISTLDKHIGLRVKMRRILLNLTQENLAQKLNITFQQIQKYEKALNRISASRLYEIAQVLNIDINYFFEGYYRDSQNTIKENIGILNYDLEKICTKPNKKLHQKNIIESLTDTPLGANKKQFFDIITQQFEFMQSLKQ